MKTKNKFRFLLVAALGIVTMTSCDPKTEVEEKPSFIISTGLLVLNSGKMDANNSTLNYYDSTTQVNNADAFNIKNNRGLGDTGQDMIKYGGKIYISVYGSGIIEVIDAKTAVSTKTISVTNIIPGSKCYPRYFAIANGKVYVTVWDKTLAIEGKGTVAMLDTTSLTITKTTTVGSYPEKCAIVNNKLYVANSGGLNKTKDSTMSIVDLTSFTEIKKIKVGLNPGSLLADNYGDVYVITNGNYGSIKPLLVKFDTNAEKITELPNIKATHMAIAGDKAYMYYSDYDALWTVQNKQFSVYDVKNDPATTTNFISADLIKTNTSSIDIDPITNLVYISETDYTNNGTMHCYDQTGVEKYKFTTGLNPQKVIFLSKK